jgi:hypothetical protein
LGCEIFRTTQHHLRTEEEPSPSEEEEEEEEEEDEEEDEEEEEEEEIGRCQPPSVSAIERQWQPGRSGSANHGSKKRSPKFPIAKRRG